MSSRILLADDHAILRDGLRALLVAAGHTIVGEAADGRAAARLAAKHAPDVVVIDLGMPLLNGVDATGSILRGSPKSLVIALTVHTEERYVLESLNAGARGYVIKSQAMSDLLAAIDQVTRGSIYLSPGLPETIFDRLLHGNGAAPPSLTPREREVLQLIAEGKRSKEVADELGISVRTAEAHRANIMDKLSIRDTAGLVRYAIRCGLIGP